MKSLDKKKVKKFPKFMYTIDGQHHYIDGRPVSLQEFIARDGFRKADKKKTKELDWEKEFDEQFDHFPESYYEGIVGKDNGKYNNTLSGLKEIKDFISSILQKQREEILKQIKSLKEEPSRQGIIDILNEL